MLFALVSVAAAVPSGLFLTNKKNAGAVVNPISTQDTLSPVLPSVPSLLSDTLPSNDAADIKDSLALNDSLEAKVSAISKLLPDTTKMDSLQLAIYHHNKAIDDSLALDSMNRKRKNGIDAPVTYTASDSRT